MKFRDWFYWSDMFNAAIRFVTEIETIDEAAFPAEWASQIIASPKLQAWIQSHGIEPKIDAMKEGGVGYAYLMGDFVLKLTADRNEAVAAAVLKKYKSPYTAEVYDVLLAGTFTNNAGIRKQVYAILQQRLNTDISKKHRIAGDAVYSYLDHRPGLIEDEDAATRITTSAYLSPKHQRDPAIRNIIRQMFHQIKTIHDESGVLTQDPHGGNLAFKGRNLAFFDFGRSSVNYNHPATDNVKITNI